MAFTAQDVIDRAADVLNDVALVRWTLAEHLRWINDGAKEIVIRRPAAGATTQVVSLLAGTYQTLPTGGIELLDVTRNMAVDGVTPKRAVRRVDRQLLDDQDPDWHSSKQSSTVQHFTFDERSPAVFYVYPPAVVGTKVELLFSKAPTDATAANSSIAMDTQYLGPLVSYVLYRALAKDSEYANGAVAAAHYQAFTDALGSNNQVTAMASPNEASA